MSDSLRPHECSTRWTGLPVHHQFPEFTQTHIHPVGDAILCCPLSSCPQSLPASGAFPMSHLFASGGQSICSSIPVLLPLDFRSSLPVMTKMSPDSVKCPLGTKLPLVEDHCFQQKTSLKLYSWLCKGSGCLVTQSCLTLCDPMDHSTTGFTVLHCLPEFAQTHVC